MVEALKKEFPSLTSELKATLFKPNRREQRKALVEMEEKEALSVLRKGKLKLKLGRLPGPSAARGGAVLQVLGVRSRQEKLSWPRPE